MKNFAADAVKVKVDGKIKELQGKRDIIGRLLYLAVIEDLDLHVVFTYPLTPVPLSLAHVNDTLHKTDKTKLMHKLEEKVTSGTYQRCIGLCCGCNVFLRSQVLAPKTFVELAKRGLTLCVIHTQFLRLKM